MKNKCSLLLMLALFFLNNAAISIVRSGDDLELINSMKKKCCMNNDDWDAKNCYALSEKLALKGNTYAQMMFASLNRDGIETKIDLKQAFYWYGKATKGGHSVAFISLARFYEDGVVVKKDVHKAIALYEAAAKCDSDALICLGDIFLNGDDGIKQDVPKAIAYYEKAKNLGNPAGYVKLSGLYSYEDDHYIPHDFDKCISYREKAAEMGNVFAMSSVGAMYAYGMCGVKKDVDKAGEWYLKAINQSKQTDIFAINAYAVLLIEEFVGEGDKPAREAGFKYLTYTANKGSSQAQRFLADYYRKGIGTEKNEELAKYWEEQAKNNPNKGNLNG